ncbi:MAG: spore coat U domain-containing protein [Burkholderiaceae bacterium]
MKPQTRLVSIRLALASLLGAVVAAPALADTESASFNVGMEVVATCSINASDISFSTITTGTTTVNDSEGQITVNCSNGAPYSVKLNDGSNFSDGRRLASNGSFITYDLFKDVNRTSPWGTALFVSGTGNGSNQLLPVYGRIPSGQLVPEMGNYADTVVATISY